ncbi:tRNA-uridine aminocarboxypropyltransferase [Anatilimnocola sp. NA78]|uniref:tRNA-uridine aminocarboxypropyltransferase n=1 Tax=Anatilimnocola sp. NA78 TaxID=3415683 RepID=UPI003CE4C718
MLELLRSVPQLDDALARGHRDRCYDCFRPAVDCFCETIPRIANRTEVLILQHRQERFHAFNTARIVRQALQNSVLLIDRTKRLAERMVLRPGAGLLYPGPGAQMLTAEAIDRPQQLVVLDGTWHHTKTLLRDLPALQALPRYQLQPAEPSRFRIRLEPQATCLSTVEATVAALRLLEPETTGFDQLLAAFDRMVERQLARAAKFYPLAAAENYTAAKSIHEAL